MEPSFKVGDKVILKPKEELTRQWYKCQENGVGTILETDRSSFNGLDVSIKWSNGYQDSYCSKDLILKETTMTRTIPSKDQVLKAASSCLQTKETLKSLFPQDFEEEFDWEEFKDNPFTQLLVIAEHNQIVPSERLKEAYARKGTPIPMTHYPSMTLNIMVKLLDFLNYNVGE